MKNRQFTYPEPEVLRVEQVFEGTAVKVFWKMFFCPEVRSPGKPLFYLINNIYFKTVAAAKEAGIGVVKAWGPNKVYLGCSPVVVNGQTYYENGFNVWD